MSQTAQTEAILDNIRNLAASAFVSDLEGLAVIEADTGLVQSDNKRNIFSYNVAGLFDNIDYDGHLDSFIEQMIITEDQNKTRIAMELNLVMSNLYNKRAYYVNYRVYKNEKIYHYQTKFCKAENAGRNLIAVGTYDITGAVDEYIKNIDHANKRIDSLTNEQNRFLVNLSHDIKTPLDEVMDMVEMAKRNVSDVDKVSKYLENMTSESNHLQSLLNDVLDVSNLEDNHVTILKRPMNIPLFAGSCIDAVERKLRDKEINLTTEFSNFIYPNVLGDETHLQRIIVNVLDNAIKFTRNGDIIFFRITDSIPNNDKVTYRFEIEDTGVGMRPEFIEHIFDPFSQEYKSSLDARHGSGLGLTISKKLLELMGGHITVKSTPGIGSKFTITIDLDIDRETEQSLARRN